MKNSDLDSARLDILENNFGIGVNDPQTIENSEGIIALAGLKDSQNLQEDLQKVIKYISNLDAEIERLTKLTSKRKEPSQYFSDKRKEKSEVLDKLFDPELLKIDGIASYIAESNSNLEQIILEKDPEYIKSFQDKLYQEKMASLSGTEEDKLKEMSIYFREMAEKSNNIILYGVYEKSHENLLDIYYDESLDSHLDKYNEEITKTFDKDAALKSEVKRQNKVLMARKRDREYLVNKEANHKKFLGTLQGRSYEDKKALFLAHFFKESAEIYVEDHNSRAEVKLPIKQKFEVLLIPNEDLEIKEVADELKGSLDTYIARMNKTLGSELSKYGAGVDYRESILPNSPYIKTAAKLEKLAEVKTKEEKVSLAAKAYKAIKDLFGNPISIFKKARSQSNEFDCVRMSISREREFEDKFNSVKSILTSEPTSGKHSRSFLDKIKRSYSKSKVISSAKSLGLGNAKTLLRTTKPSRERV